MMDLLSPPNAPASDGYPPKSLDYGLYFFGQGILPLWTIWWFLAPIPRMSSIEKRLSGKDSRGKTSYLYFSL